MTSPAVLERPPEAQSETKRAFLLVFSCTLIGALAQILVKEGTAQLGKHVTLGQVMHNPGLFVSLVWA